MLNILKPCEIVKCLSLQEDEDEDENDIPPDVASAIDAGDVLKSESKYRLILKARRKRSAQRVKRMASFKPTAFIDTPITMETSRHDEGTADRPETVSELSLS